MSLFQDLRYSYSIYGTNNNVRKYLFGHLTRNSMFIIGAQSSQKIKNFRNMRNIVSFHKNVLPTKVNLEDGDLFIAP